MQTWQGVLAACVLVALSTASVVQFLEGDVSSNIRLMKAGSYNPYREFNQLVNDVFFSWTGLGSIPRSVETLGLSGEASYYLLCYLRDLVLGTLVYWGTAGAWHIYIYRINGDRLFTQKGRNFPTGATIRGQMQLAQSSLLLYAALPIMSEFLIESGYTRVYFYVDEVGGWVPYVGYLLLYIAAVEVGIYWMHRTLHENKFLYLNVHRLHHQYKDPETLTPWCSLAFNPLDGILQACPYVICLLFVPCHYFTHVFLLFFSGVWATNIHDSVVSMSAPRQFDEAELPTCSHSTLRTANLVLHYLRSPPTHNTHNTPSPIPLSLPTRSPSWAPSTTPSTTPTTSAITGSSSPSATASGGRCGPSQSAPRLPWNRRRRPRPSDLSPSRLIASWVVFIVFLVKLMLADTSS